MPPADDDVPSIGYPFPRTSPIEPSPQLRRVREQAPLSQVRMVDGRDAWLVTRYEDVKLLLADRNFGTSYPGVPPVGPDDPIAAFMFLTDPPEHTRLRRQVSKAFTERRIVELRHYATGVAQDLVRAMKAAGDSADLQSAFAYPLPIAVISELLGIPDTGRDKFRRWADIVLRPAGLPGAEVQNGFEELRRFVIDVVEAKPDGADLLSRLMADSRAGEGLSRAEVHAMALGLLMAGYITTAHAITTGVVRLMLHRDLFTGLAVGTVDPAALVEELLRCQDEEIGIQRIAQQDVEFRGDTIRYGDIVIVSRAGANRDPEVFEQGDQLRLTGDSGRAHLTFGFGPHHCLGAALARMEMTVALVTLATTVPTLELAAPLEQIGWHSDGMDISLRSLPVRW